MLVPESLKNLLRPLFRSARFLHVYIRIVLLRLTNRFSRAPVIHEEGPVVSLTTHGVRILTVHLALESIARGSVKPSRMILWLDDEAEFSHLSVEIIRLVNRGLEVKLSEAKYGPHTKYYPYVRSTEIFDVPLATADDDIIYPKHWLKRLVHAYRNNSEVVNCYRARVVSFSGDLIEQYDRWQMCSSVEASFLHFATGVSGVIYPPRLLEALKVAGSGFTQCCPKADDLWLHAQALRAGYRVRQIGRRSLHFTVLPDTQQIALQRDNVLSLNPGNDKQTRMTYNQADIEIMRS
jgi:hypothetical protein